MKAMLLVLFLILVSGCASNTNTELWQNDQVYNNISVNYDSFRKRTSYTAPSITIANQLSKRTWFVRVFEHQDSTLWTQLHVSVSYLNDNFKHLINAKSNGELFPIRSIRQNASVCNETEVCNFQEDVIITVSLDKLNSLINEDGVVLFEITDRFGDHWSVKLEAQYLGALEAKIINVTNPLLPKLWAIITSGFNNPA